jgi:hypothetical protein
MTAGKMLKLIEAFRIVLRAGYSQRPGLADEIQDIHYFRYSPFDESTGWRLDPEVQAADFAYAELKDAIMSGAIRLRGIVNGGMPDDIEPMEITRNEIAVFDNKMDVCDGPRTLRTYRKIHCYAADIDALIGLPIEAAPLGVTKDRPAALSPTEACRALIEAHKDSDRPKDEIESDARAIPGFLISTFPSMWKDYASAYQKRQGRRPRSVAAG